MLLCTYQDSYGFRDSRASKLRTHLLQAAPADSRLSPLIHNRPHSTIIIITDLKETSENAEVRKELWKKFSDKTPMIELIKEMGLNPGVVSSEFEFFLKFIDRDPYPLQKDMQRITGTDRL